MSRDILGCHDKGGAAKAPTVHRIAPATKNDLASRANRAKAEKPGPNDQGLRGRGG